MANGWAHEAGGAAVGEGRLVELATLADLPGWIAALP